MTLVHVIVFTLKRPSLDLDRVDIAVALHREHAGKPRRLNPRQARNPTHNFPLKAYCLLVTLVDRGGSHHLHGCKMVWIKAQRHTQKTIEALSEQSGSGQQHDR